MGKLPLVSQGELAREAGLKGNHSINEFLTQNTSQLSSGLVQTAL